MSYTYTCNGSLTGCERERFGTCGYHEEIEKALADSPLTSAAANLSVAIEEVVKLSGPYHVHENTKFITIATVRGAFNVLAERIREEVTAEAAAEYRQQVGGHCRSCGRVRGGP